MRDFSKGYPDRQTAGRGSLKKVLAKHGIEDLSHDVNDTQDRQKQSEINAIDPTPTPTSTWYQEQRSTDPCPPPHNEECALGSELPQQQAAKHEWELVQTFRKLPKSAQFRVMAAAERELERLPSLNTKNTIP
jgi:hypothetical protein